MKKPAWKLVTKPVEETEFYVVDKVEAKKFKIYHKTNDTVITCSEYKIVGSAVMYKDMFGTKMYYNEDSMQKYGLGNHLSTQFEIDSWKVKKVEGKEQIMLKYVDEKGYKYLRQVDEKGNLFKKAKKAKVIKDETASL